MEQRIPTAAELDCLDEPKLGAVEIDGETHVGLRETQIRAVWPDDAEAIIDAARAALDDCSEHEQMRRDIDELKARVAALEAHHG